MMPTSQSHSDCIVLPEQVSCLEVTDEPLTIQNAIKEGQVAYPELLFTKKEADCGKLHRRRFIVCQEMAILQ